MDFFRIAILALIQGAAELLPVSSSAHVIVAERLMGLDPSSPEMTFLLVMLHTGTMFAVLFYFWPRWRALFASEPGRGRRFVKAVTIASVCTAVVGLGLKVLLEKVVLERALGHEKGEVETLFRSLPLMALGLATVGVLIVVSGMRATKVTLDDLSARTSAWIGLTQGLCLPVRGFSRSGATISVALFRGMPRALAEDFSFALAVVLTPAVVLLELKRLLESRSWRESGELGRLLLPGAMGAILSFAAGLAALWLLSRALEKGAWKYFGYYCLLAAAAVCILWGIMDWGIRE